MKYIDFQNIMSVERMNRYFQSTGNNSRKAMTLYRANLKLSQELFTIISCFEVALRNAIDRHYTALNGNDWLRDSALPMGMYNARNCGKTPGIIALAMRKLTVYSHTALIAQMDFGFWRYTFARHQFYAGGQGLLTIFPSKPVSTATHTYNYQYFFDQLERINNMRNRLAHHEPVCFRNGFPIIDTSYSRRIYDLLIRLFQWMDIDESSLLYGLDHVSEICDKIDVL